MAEYNYDEERKRKIDASLKGAFSTPLEGRASEPVRPSPSPTPSESDAQRTNRLREAAEAAKARYMKDNNVDENGDKIKPPMQRRIDAAE